MRFHFDDKGVGGFLISYFKKVTDIEDHLSVGEEVRVRILSVSHETNHLALSMCPSLIPGQQFTGTVVRLLGSGAVVDISDHREHVFVPHGEVADFGSLEVAVLRMGEAFLLTVGAFLLAVKLLCLQSLKALIRRTFPL